MSHSDRKKAVPFRSCSLSASNRRNTSAHQWHRHTLRIPPCVGRTLLLVFTAVFSCGAYYARCGASEAAVSTLNPGSHRLTPKMPDARVNIHESGAATETPGPQREISNVQGTDSYAPTAEPGAAGHQWLGTSRAPVTEPGTPGQGRTVGGASWYYNTDAEADDSLAVEGRAGKRGANSAPRARGAYTAGETSTEQRQGLWPAFFAMGNTVAQKVRQQGRGETGYATEGTQAEEANVVLLNQETYVQDKEKGLQKQKSDQEEEKESTEDSAERRMEETEQVLEERLVEVEEEGKGRETSEQHSKAQGEAAEGVHAEENKEQQLDTHKDEGEKRQETTQKEEGERKLEMNVTAEPAEMEKQEEKQEEGGWKQEEEEAVKAEGKEKEKQEEEGHSKLQVTEVATALGSEKPTRKEKHEGDEKKEKVGSGVEGNMEGGLSGEALESDVNEMQGEGKEEQGIKAKEWEKIEERDTGAPQREQGNQGGKEGVKESGKDSIAEWQEIEERMLQKEEGQKEGMESGAEREKEEEQGKVDSVPRERKLGAKGETEEHEGIQEKVAAQGQNGDEEQGKGNVKKEDFVIGGKEEKKQAQKWEGKREEDVVAQGKKQGDQGQEKRSMEKEHDVKKSKEEQGQALKREEEKKEEGVTVPATAKDKQDTKQQEKGQEMEELLGEKGGLEEKVAVEDARGVKGNQLDKGTQGNKQKEEGGAAKGDGADLTTRKETSGSAEEQRSGEQKKDISKELVDVISQIDKERELLEKAFFSEYLRPPHFAHPLCVFPDSPWCAEGTLHGNKFPSNVSDLIRRMNAFFGSMFKLPLFHVALPSPHLWDGGLTGTEQSVQPSSTCHLAFSLDPQALTVEPRLYMTPSEHRVGVVADRRVQRSEQDKALSRVFRSETRLHAVASVADECMLSEKLAEAGLIGWSHDGVLDSRVRILVTFPSKAHAKDLLEHEQLSEEAYKRFVEEKDLEQLPPDEKCLLSGRTQIECDRLKAEVSEERESVIRFATQGYAENEIRIPQFKYA